MSLWTLAVDLLSLTAGALIVGLEGPAGISFVVLGLVATSALDRKDKINPFMHREAALLAGRLAIVSVAVALLVPSAERAVDVLRAAVLALLLVLISRGLVYAALRLLRRFGIGLRSTIVVGAGTVGTQVAESLLRHPEYGLHPVGMVDVVDGTELPVPLVGHPGELPQLINRLGVDTVIVAFGPSREAELLPLLRLWEGLPVETYFLPRFFELAGDFHSSQVEDLWGFPLVRRRPPAFRSPLWPAKRLFDVVTSSLLLIPAAPVLLASAVAVRLSGQGPIIFRQKRIGLDGAAFELLKFRTMEPNDDADTTWSVEDDDRVTKVGRILRKTHLDELPQLFNVLRGDMSIVGPRPERPHFVDEFASEIAGYLNRHRVPVGITGWAQVHGLWGDTSIEDRARFDNRYVEEWSLWKDILILLRTLPTIFGRRAE